MLTHDATILLLVTSDIHGYVYPTTYRDQSDHNFGLAKIATIMKEKRKNEHVILVDNGDFIQGSPLTYYHAKIKPNIENPTIKLANSLQYDAIVIGNHEFNYGLNYLTNAITQSSFPWLSANIVNSKTGSPAFGKPYLIKSVAGVKIAILGVTTQFIPNWEDPKNIKGLDFKDALDSVNEWVQKIRSHEKPDVLIVSYHGGFEKDLQTGEPTEPLTGENQAYDMCQQLEGVDVLITGHQHRTLADKVNGITIIQPGFHGHFLGEVQINVTKQTGHPSIITTSARLIELDETVKSDQETEALIADMEEETQGWLDTQIGMATKDMILTDPLKTRLQDSPYIEFINKVQMDAAGVDISNTALFTNESRGFHSVITMRDILTNYIYPNTLTVIRVSGEDIKHALEQSAKYFTIENGNITVSHRFIKPKPQHYNYDMWEGIDYELKISNPIGKRVVKLNYHGKPLDLNKQYDIVLNSYRAGGAGNFDMFKGKPIIQSIQTDMVELIANYIRKHKMIDATCDHNWRVVI
jgi:2',3'-cyclic-nucleotide 2'-phosphodiesterase/3'-nucleotidase